MARVLVVGRGFAGELHGRAWESLGHEVRYYDPRLGLDSLDELMEWADIVDFCDTPLSRALYTDIYADVLAGKDAVFYEKPPYPTTSGWAAAWRDTVRRLNAVPVHNYLYMPQVRRAVAGGRGLRVVVLRRGPHKAWYPDPVLTGGGILADHGYHWLYVYREMLGGDLSTLQCYVDDRIDYHASCEAEGLRMTLSWLSAVEDTLVNGDRLQPPPYHPQAQYESFKALFASQSRWDQHREASVEVLEAIARVYGSPLKRYPAKEGPTAAELHRLLPTWHKQAWA